MSNKEKVKESFIKANVQMQTGCENKFCLNPYCHHSLVDLLTPNQIVLKVMEYFKKAPGNNLFDSPDFIFCEQATLIILPQDSYSNTSDCEVLNFFSDPRSLGSSFKNEQTQKVDFKSLDSFYSRCSELVSQGLLRPNWLQDCIKNFYQSKYSSFFLPDCFLLILSSPLLAEVENMDITDLLGPLITPERLKKLSLSMDQYSVDQVHRVNSSLQQIISIKIIQNLEVKSVKLVINELEILQSLYDSNEKVPRIGFKEFYNDAANDETDKKQDFKNWYTYKYRSLSEENLTKNAYFCFPWLFNANFKSLMLSQEILEIMRNEIRNSIHIDYDLQIFVFLEVNRNNLVEDTLRQVSSGELNLRKPLKIHFLGEEGIDEGGVKKEFFQLIVKELFDQNFGMFHYYEDQRLFWFNPDTIDSGINFELIGKILGLAIYNSIILDVHLPMAAYKKILNLPTGISDLEEFNPELARGLTQLLNFEGNVEEVFCRSFYIETHSFGEIIRHELKPNGESIPVTNANRVEYVNLYVNWWLNQGVSSMFSEFKNGFLSICGGEVLNVFKAEELELLVCGNPILDFKELEKVTKYEGYTKDSKTVKSIQVLDFWEIIHEFNDEQKRKFLCFVTGSDRAPINGLGNMDLIISRTGGDTKRLMTAHTCFNYLVLPDYQDKENMKKLMITAIENASGFGLR